VIADLDNIRAAFTWAAAVGDADLALRICTPLGAPWSGSGAVTLLDVTLALALPDAPDHPLYPEALAWAGWAQGFAGESEDAQRIGERALAACDRLGVDGPARCRVWFCVAFVTGFAGRYDDAGRLAERWLKVARSAGDDLELVRALNYRAANLSTARGDLAAARDLAEEALTLSRSIANPTAVGFSSFCASLVWVADEPDRAMDLATAGAEAFESVGADQGLAHCLACQGWIDLQRGDVAQAASLLARSVDLLTKATVTGLGGWLAEVALILQAGADDEGAAVLRGTAPVTAARSVIPLAAEQLAETVEALRRRLGDERFVACTRHGSVLDPDDIATVASERLRRLADDLADGKPT